MKKIMLTILVVCTCLVSSVFGNDSWYSEKFPANLVNASGKSVDASQVLKGKMVAVYFSASWCPPCRKFTPRLVKMYKSAAKKQGLEIVLVSSDKTAKAMQSYMKKYSMPWYAVPFGDPAVAALKKELKATSIPRLVVFSSEGKVISGSAVRDVLSLGAKAVDAWKSPDYKPAASKKVKKEDKSSSKKEDKSSEKKSKKSKTSKKSKDADENEQ